MVTSDALFAKDLPAFPGAAGPGSNATGGRGGDVYHVTTVDPDPKGEVEGSFHHGVKTAPASGRTIVFDVGGTIHVTTGGPASWFRLSPKNLTIAGQTAPAPGVTIAGTGTKLNGDNVVLRHLTFRPGKDVKNPQATTFDALAVQATNSIIDHVTCTWAGDEGLSTTDAVQNTTVQWSVIAESLNYKGHAFGSMINTERPDARVAYHHNLYAHHKTRVPRVGSETGTGAVAAFVNNVVYNWSGDAAGYSAKVQETGAQEPSRTNFVNNVYLVGPDGGRVIFRAFGDRTEIFQRGNVIDVKPDATYDGKDVGWEAFEGPGTRAGRPFDVTTGEVDRPQHALEGVLKFAGARWWDRAPTDARIVESVRHGTGKVIDDVPPDEWKTIVETPMTSRPAGFDTDRDGMPDAWEKQHGFDPAVPDNNGDADDDGYTNLEEYLNELADGPNATAASGAK